MDDASTYDPVVFAPQAYIFQAFEQQAISFWTQNPYSWHYVDFVEDKAMQIRSLRWCPKLTTKDHEIALGNHSWNGKGQILYESMERALERMKNADNDASNDGGDDDEEAKQNLPLGWWEGRTANGRIM